MGYAAIVAAILGLVLAAAARSTAWLGVGLGFLGAVLSVVAVRRGERSLGILGLVLAAVVAITAPFMLLRDLDKPSEKKTAGESIEGRAKSGIGPLSEEVEQGLAEQAKDHVQVVDFKGQRILKVDCSAEKAEEAAAIIDRALTVVASDPESARLILADIENCANNAEVMKKAKELAAPKKKALSKGAIVGASTAEKIIIRSAVTYFGVGGKVSFFSDEEEAKEWLAD